MRIDSHQHFWSYDASEYPWIGESMGVLRRDFLPPDLEPHLAAHGLDGSVAVQARQSLAETRWLLQLAREHARVVVPVMGPVMGIVGWVDLCSEEVGAQLAELGPDPLLVGVRHVAQDEPDDRFLVRADFQRGIARLAEHGLRYDLLVYPRQLPAAEELVRAFPEQPFVLDHVAKPPIAEGRLDPWRDDLRRLAEHPNVCCKVSGLVTEADWKSWRPADFGPYLEVVREAFGEERLMYGSDWPVCLVAGDYGAVAGLAESFAAELSEEGRRAFFGGNAARFYGLAE